MKSKKQIVAAFLMVLIVIGLSSGVSAKTLKIGVIESLTWPLGVDAVNAIKLDVEKINKAGGLPIGGERYKIKAIIDDGKADAATAKTAAEKQIFRDGVKFIKGDTLSLSYVDVCEENKVVATVDPATDEPYDPRYNYIFSISMANVTWPSLIPWYAKKFPDKKTFLTVQPDRFNGRYYASIWQKAAKSAGLKTFPIEYFPPATIDLSAVGTKISRLNPDILAVYGGGPQTEALLFKAARAAGYKGQILSAATIPAKTVMGIAGPDVVEGMISLAWPAEFEPAATPLAVEFKQDWINKYGKWTDPEIVSAIPWHTLLAGLRKASKPDPDEVRKIIGGGMSFNTPFGHAKMISRPDLNNPRTIQVVMEMYVKKIEGGKIKHIDTISIDEVVGLASKIYGW